VPETSALSELVAFKLGSKIATISFIELIPIAETLLNLNRRREVVSQNAAQGAGRMRALGDQARIAHEAFIRYLHLPADMIGAHPDQIEQRMSKRIGPSIAKNAEFVKHRRTILLPGPIKQRKNPVIKEIEEIGERVILGRLEGKQPLRVVKR